MTRQPGDSGLYIAAFPKSGSTWLSYLLSDCLGVAYANKMGEVPALPGTIREIDRSAAGPVTFVERIHTARPDDAGRGAGDRVVYLVRDGRDIVVSYHFWRYFHVPERWPPHRRLKDLARRYLRGGFEGQLEHTVREQAAAWRDHVENWEEADGSLPRISYEELHRNPYETLRSLFDELQLQVADEAMRSAVDRHTFAAETGRDRGQEERSAFRRKGIVGDWQNYFSERHRQAFKAAAGDLLIRLGYEEDDRW